MFATVGRVVESYVSRGDVVPDVPDFTLSNLITDGTNRDLDLSAIVPAGAKVVLLNGLIYDNVVGSVLTMFKKGFTSMYEAWRCRTQIANTPIDFMACIECDTNRKITYNASNTVWTGISITVAGWWK